ncbi:uncharacterized protein [Lolium perenne]|uniref:uncharacterized protein n=1 Tax=Lolium perenne TaxID=4522 RepID=UPI0021F6741A|nr:uncharacterized protein LOC127317515 isoform X2 [Lolium perenne]
MEAVFFGDLEPSLQTLLAQGGGCVGEVEAIVGCSSQPSCLAAHTAMAVREDSSSSHGSGNSVVGANGHAGDAADQTACASLAGASEASGCALVSGWKRRDKCPN